MSLGFPIYRSMPFTKSFPNYITFLSFSCLIAVTKATNIMLEKRARVNNLILFFTLMENFQVFTCIMLTMIYIHRLYHVEACSLCTAFHPLPVSPFLSLSLTHTHPHQRATFPEQPQFRTKQPDGKDIPLGHVKNRTDCLPVPFWLHPSLTFPFRQKS